MSKVLESVSAVISTDAPLIASEATMRFRSPLRYPGGKQKAINQIANLLPVRMIEYREPFVGGGSVYLHARSVKIAQKYWLNDKFTELTSFWRVVQDETMCAKLIEDLEKLRSSFKSSEEIKKYFLKAREQKAKSRYQEALLFFFFNRVTFSGTTKAGGFSGAASLNRFTASSIQRLAPMPQALEGTQITNLDFEEVISAPGEDVFMFLDPPYYTASKLYGRSGALHAFDHEQLAKILKRTKHKFLITYDDCPEIRSLFEWANIQNWQLQYGMNNCNLERASKVGSELFISNY
jgi:DNA adenine methylase